MRVRDPVELLYLGLMQRWTSTAPADGCHGALDGNPEQNSQVARLGYVLQKIAAGQVDKYFAKLEKLTRRRDGCSYVSKDSVRMKEPRLLWEGWYLEGCASLEQKRGIIRNLRQLGLSPSSIGIVQMAGVIVTLTGSIIALWCVLIFAESGRGTPIPFDPPRRLVVSGPYRVVRNPMALGVGAALAGVALFYESAQFLLAVSCLGYTRW